MFALQHFGEQTFNAEGSLNITAEHAEDLLEQLNFAEECLRNGKDGMAVDAIGELISSHRNSPSLLLKIMLSDTRELLSKSVSRARALGTLKSLKSLVLKKCRLSQPAAPVGVVNGRRRGKRAQAFKGSRRLKFPTSQTENQKVNGLARYMLSHSTQRN